MSFPKFNDDTQNISSLSDRPNDMDGMSAAELKAMFDKVGTDIKAYLNDVLIPSLGAETAAENIGVAPISGMTATNVQAAISELFQAIRDAAIEGLLPDNSVTTAKIALAAITAALLADGSVTEPKIGTGAVTGEKIPSDTLETEHYKDRSITSGKIALAAIVTALLADGCVTEPKIGPGAVTGPKIADEAVSYAKTSGVQAKHKAVTVTVASIAAGGTRDVNVSGVTASNTVIVTPAPASFIKWRDCGVRCSAQAAGQLTFAAETATGQNLTAYVVILD